VSVMTPEKTCEAEIVNGPSHHPGESAFKFQVGQMFLMYVSETTLGPRMMTPAAEATNARKSVALCDVIEQEDTTAARFSAACLTSHRIG